MHSLTDFGCFTASPLLQTQLTKPYRAILDQHESTRIASTIFMIYGTPTIIPSLHSVTQDAHAQSAYIQLLSSVPGDEILSQHGINKLSNLPIVTDTGERLFCAMALLQLPAKVLIGIFTILSDDSSATSLLQLDDSPAMCLLQLPAMALIRT